MEHDYKVRIDADYLKTPNYALYHNRLPVGQAIEITNLSETPIEGISVKCSGEYMADYESHAIDRINPGETVRISPFNINPDPAKLAAITERVATGFKVTATSEGETIGEAEFELEFMPYDHWTGTEIFPQTLASFVTPNHPSIAQLVQKSAAFLKELTGSSALIGYQTGNPTDVRRQVAAVFAAIHSAGIAYRVAPASFEETGQRITMPDQVLTSKIANCLELTLLMASALEAIGLNALIILEEGHAYLGVWLEDDCYRCSVGDDPAYIEKKCSQGIDEMLVVECTQAVKENASYEEAIRIAEMKLADHEKFELFIDVKRSRLERIRPLPTRMESGTAATFETEGIEHDSLELHVEERDKYDLTHLTSDGRELTKFDIWERKLLDFTLRNTLLNISLRRRAIQFISFDIDRIEDHLQKGGEYLIMARPNVEIQTGATKSVIRSKLHEPLHALINNDTEHGRLHTYLPEEEISSVLKNIYRTARNTLEESGANTLFLAIGTLRWYETEQSTKPRYAPLLLLPVEMDYRKGNYYIRSRDEEITINITLMEFLRQNFDISIPDLDPLPTDGNGVDVPLIFAAVRNAIKDQKRWDVDEECLLGIFSFSKYLMWNDVHNHRDELADNKVVSSLISNRLNWTPETNEKQIQEIDKHVSPADIALPLPVDSSQLTAVVEGWSGNSFIIYGPPGTGKSQTITNLIANALYHGKRVLFVAEKMAALTVVQSRLEKIGIGAFCLELHSNKATKRHVLKQLDMALKATSKGSPEYFESVASKIFESRKELIDYVKALHKRDDSDGLSPYDCITKADSIHATPMPGFRFDRRIDSFMSKEGVNEIEQILGKELPIILSITGQPSEHPLNGLEADASMLKDSDSIADEMRGDADALDAYAMDMHNLNGISDLHLHLKTYYTDRIFDEDAEAMLEEWKQANAKWLLPRIFAKRKMLRRLKDFNPLLKMEEIGKLIDKLLSYGRMHDKITYGNSLLKKHFNLEYDKDKTADLRVIAEKSETLRRWAKNITKTGDWLHWIQLRDKLTEHGMESVVTTLDTTAIDPATIKDSFLKALYLHKAHKKTAADETLARFAGILMDMKISVYRQFNDMFQDLTRKEIYARLASRVPRSGSRGAGGEMELLRRNISNGGRGKSLRDLFDQLPTLMPRLCPCMLMSPISVAQYIDLKAEPFDLVIFDEASQMPTSEAVGSIARGKALIVVGDPKQMPPTSFFSSTNVDAEEAYIDDMESILEDCRTLDMPSVQLSWHYRSRHESLIAFSNNEYYDGSLITFPSVDDKSTKVHYVPVEGGVYDKGGKRCNEAEAQAIVDEIARRLKSETLRNESIGVIAFSVMQQGLIEDLLQDRIERDSELLAISSSMYEPIFVKNLENVQGDERDVILFSVGYGPDKNGKISMNFGPLNNAGGERRLNVAVSRARKEMYVFSTLKAADIDLHRSKAKGVEGLKHFLQYAETQTLPTAAKKKHRHKHSPIADSIARELRKLGYTVTTDVGRSQFRVDIAVESKKNPGKYGLAILLDGEDYRDTKTMRDREVVQPSVLKDLKWSTMRVWSIDWLKDRGQVIDSILERLKYC